MSPGGWEGRSPLGRGCGAQPPAPRIVCKVPPNPLNKKATREHEDKMVKVKECLQDQHSFESQEEFQWALVPPTDVDRF